MRQSVVIAVLPFVVASALALSACSSDEPEAAATPTPTGFSAAEWADAVCTSYGDLVTDLGSVTDGLSVELSTGDALDQVTTQLRANVADVGMSMNDLVSAIAEAPDTEEAQALRDTLQSGVTEVTSATQQVNDAARRAADASTAMEFVAAAGTTLTATSTAVSAARAFGTDASSAASGAGDALRSAFADTESCRALSDAQ